MQHQPTDIASLQEVRRLLAERSAKKRELDAIDLALEKAVGMDSADRPRKSRMSPKDLRRMGGLQ